ncbi:acetoacetate--CoA ligase [Cucumibacter marinus]|uniref:acetoacetate--CoA ligase n=1 Tax=Cucumibacter marinus TaxID=1121252 RepID=UPI0004004828|nr:acetoacetate--CoA ligase [Cucumibacter marinus]
MTEPTATPEPLWSPAEDRIAEATMTRFRAFCGERSGDSFADTPALHRWSLDHTEDFWDAIWDFGGVVGEKGERRLIDGDKMPGARFFPDAKLNFAENLLRGTGGRDAIVFKGEDKVSYRWSWDELRQKVSMLQQAMRAMGIGPGDRVAALMPNMPEAVAGMLAATSIGAVWSSASPDFGERGVLDRFGQIEPKLLIACDGYWYNGKAFDIGDKLKAVTARLPTLEKTVIVSYAGDTGNAIATLPNADTMDGFMAPHMAREVEFTRLPFDHPVYILFSSGTTGVPKCIVHRAGGVLLQHLKEHLLHADTNPGDRVFYFTTLGWMMWNWLVSALACEATLLLFDGSPFAGGPEILFDYADAEAMTLFGTSAKYIDAVRKSGLEPKTTHRLEKLKSMASTGSPLSPENFDFVYAGIKSDIHLASISGGTDIVSCFVLGDPTRPVYSGEIQGPGLGMKVEVWNENGQPVTGEKGELVCAAPFPVMPLKFWNDEGDKKYHAAYFERFDNVWCHGDYAEVTPRGGIIIHGRSDATLNPGGVRIGTAEIYNQVEQMDEVLEAICIGQDWDDDVRVILFVRLTEGVTLDEELTKAIKTKIRNGASPRHVPAKVIAIADIPRTKSGKITELAVRDVVHGREVKNKEALANPEALDLYRDLDALKS